MGAMAAVNADTWATEIGVLSKHPPRLITTWQTIDHGASGGITLLGTAATIAGSALIALFAGIFTPPNFNVIFFIVTLSGLLGSLFDSLLGATVQAIYHCPVCQKETEHHPLHSCGAHTSLKRGWNWFNNDLVNFSASITGAFVVLVIASVFN
jgi:uncharacterized membrane protein